MAVRSQQDYLPPEDLENSSGETPFIDPGALAFTGVFGGRFDYPAVQSQVLVQPYNAGLDALFSDRDRYPAPRCPGLPENAYPLAAAAVTIPAARDGEPPYFSGDLEEVDGAAVDRRLVYRFDSLEEYRTWSGQEAGETLTLGGAIRIDAPALDLTGVTRVTGGGMLAAPSVALDRLERAGDVPVSLVARTGDIRCGFTGRVQASLVALDGALRATDRSRPVDVVGNVAVKELPAGEPAAGGAVRFDTDLDPSRAGNGRDRAYRGFVADAPTAWRIDE